MATAPTPANWAAIGLLGLVWGGTFMVVAVALQGYGPLTVACARTTLGAVALLAVLAVLRRPWPAWHPRLIRSIAVIGVLNTAVPFALLGWGQQFVPSAFAGISMAALPLFVLPMAHAFGGEPMSRNRLIGVIVGFAGAVVLVGPGVLRIGSGMEPLGQIACLGAAFSYACGSIMTRRCPPVDPILLAGLTLCVGAVILIPAMLAVEGVPALAAPLPTAAIVFLGLLPTALATLLRVVIIRSAGSVFMTLVNYQVPLWSVLFGALLLSEELPLRFFAALGLILLGLAISQWASQRRLIGRAGN
ncbi:DMT family transporter [Loktanella fryxellensis]|uniref:DMT family transporter n=1 Tax=Loktanella fryxellensis TaxID=245187 RepID=UPI000B7DBDF6|nr:DMT family transporter [Loktanella fryxellensis]